MKKKLSSTTPSTKNPDRHIIPTDFSGYTLDEFKGLDADGKKTYTQFLTQLYDSNKNILREIANTTGFLPLDYSKIESLELEGFNLTSLNLQGCQNLSSLDVLQPLTSLTSLSLHGCQNLSSLDGIQHLTTLTSLNLQGCQNLSSLDVFQPLTTLTSLSLHGCQKLSSLEGIQPLTTITSLTLHGCQTLSSLDGIQPLTTLTSLTLQGCQTLSFLDGIQPLTTLTSLTLQGCQNLSSLNGIQPLTKLTSLNLSGCQNLSSLDEIQHLTKLTSLSLHGCQNLSSLNGIQPLTKLTSLNLSGCQNLSSLEGIQPLTTLTSLSLHGCQKLSSLDGIQHLTTLTSLSLQGCQTLSSFDGIQPLTTLTSLNLSGYQHPIYLSQFHSVKKIILERCSIEPNISETPPRLKALEEIQITKCNFPITTILDLLLLHAPKLKTISFFGKKHTYSEYARLLNSLSRIKKESSFNPPKTLLNLILHDIHTNPFILPMDNSMVLYHLYLLVLFAGDSLSDEQIGTLTTCLNDRLNSPTKPNLDLLGIWSLHRIGRQLKAEFNLDSYKDTFKSELKQLGIIASHQLHEILGSNTELETHIETLSAGQVESSDLQDQLTRDGVFSGIETKLKKLGINATITQEVLEMGHRLDIVVEITDTSSLTKKINIELDGGHHDTPYQKAKDEVRDRILSENGYLVVRIPNRELSNPAMTADAKVDFLIDGLKSQLPTPSAQAVPAEDCSAPSEGSASRGNRKRGGRSSGRGKV